MTDIYWRPKSLGLEYDDPITDEEMEAHETEYQEWARSPEGIAELKEVAVERMAKTANPYRLSNQVDFKDLPMHFARGVQRIWDESGSPCTLRQAGEKAGMDNDEYVIAAAFAIVQGLVRHPTHPTDPDLEAPSLFEPCVG